jgi:hypothetical protein
MPLLCCWQVHYLLQPCADYVQAAVETVVDIHREDVPGDVLVFLTGDHTISLVGFWREGEGGGPAWLSHHWLSETSTTLMRQPCRLLEQERGGSMAVPCFTWPAAQRFSTSATLAMRQ